MSRLVIAAPILPGKVEAWRRLCQEMNGRRQRAYEQSRQQLGVAGEAIWLLRAASTSVAILRVDASEPEQLLAQLAVSNHPFDRWFREQIHYIFGLKLTPVLREPTLELMHDWQQRS